MSKKHLVVIFAMFLLFTLSSQTFSQKTFNQKSDQIISESEVQLSANDKFVIHVLRVIHSAEMTFAETIGAGNFADLSVLASSGLLDVTIASGERYGYRFTVSTQYATSTSPPSFEVKAVSVIRRPKRLSFYINENCEIRGADKLGREATIDDPVIAPCAVSVLAEYEKEQMIALRYIHSAQMTYASTYGNGAYGTFSQLYNANLIRFGFGLVDVYYGYSGTMVVTPATATQPPRFVIKVVPMQYGRGGRRSFYIDETGVLRGADRQGQPADENDPPINN